MIINLCRLSHIRVIVTAKKIKPKIQLHFINIVIVNLRLTGCFGCPTFGNLLSLNQLKLFAFNVLPSRFRLGDNGIDGIWRMEESPLSATDSKTI